MGKRSREEAAAETVLGIGNGQKSDGNEVEKCWRGKLRTPLWEDWD